MPPLDVTLKFRCERALLARVHRIAAHPEHKRTMPNLGRKAMEAFADQEEKRLKLTAITDREIEQYLEKAAKGSKTSKMRRPRFQQD